MRNDKLDKLTIPEARAKAPASFTVQSLPYPENGLRKWSAFTIGVIAGAIGVTIAHSLMEELGQAVSHPYNPQ